MSPTLEDELSAGLREHAAGVHPSRDVLAAARARHRRRTVVTRAASAAGTVGLAGAVATVVAINGPVTATPAPQQTPSATVELDAATVSARITKALLDAEKSVHHVSFRATLRGETARTELWEDPESGDYRYRGRKVPSAPLMDMAVQRRGDLQITTVLDTERKVWWTSQLDVSGFPPPPRDDPFGLTSPEGLKKALAAGRWRLIGEEKIDGRDTVHLRITEQAGFEGEYDLWVDGTTYQFVRRAVVQSTDDGSLRYVEDWEYLPRTDKTLSELRITAAPKGYKKLPAPEAKG
jgi:hypothetical protein